MVWKLTNRIADKNKKQLRCLREEKNKMLEENTIMANEELYKKARARVQNGIIERRVTDCEIIIEQEKEIEYYRNIINNLRKDKKKNNSIDLDINVNREQLDNTTEELRESKDIKPHITIRNNRAVYVTINNFNETEKEWCKEAE